MAGCSQTTLGQERHAAEWGMLRRLHLRDDLLLFEVPKHDCVVKASSDDLR